MSTDMFKIQDPTTGLFSSGGADPRWSRVGKVWKRQGDLSSHFTNLSAEGRRTYRRAGMGHGAVVVKFETVTTVVSGVDVHFQAVEERAEAAERASQIRRANKQREQELAELARLQKKYSNQ